MMDCIHLQQTLPAVFADRNSIESDVWHKDIRFEKKGIYLIEAASGTGKSSLCNFIYGYRKDYQGIINFNTDNIRSYKIKQWVEIRKHLSVCYFRICGYLLNLLPWKTYCLRIT
jgi:ABC-type lipoprotein export system ATPase subunit